MLWKRERAFSYPKTCWRCIGNGRLVGNKTQASEKLKVFEGVSRCAGVNGGA